MKQFVLILVLALFLTACCFKQEEDFEVEVVASSEVIQKEYDIIHPYIGTVKEPLVINCFYSQTKETDLSFGVDGLLIERVYVSKGDHVKKGDLLAVVDLEDMETNLSQMEHEISKQQLAIKHLIEERDFELERADVMFLYTYMKEEDKEDLEETKQSINESYAAKLTQLQDALYIMELKYEQAKQIVSDGKIYAPMDGIMLMVKSELEGTLTVKDERIMSMYDPTDCMFHSSTTEAIPYLDSDEIYSVVCGLGNQMREYSVVPVRMDEWKEEIYFALLDEEYDPFNIATGKITLYTSMAEDVMCLDKYAVHEAGGRNYVYLLNNQGIRIMQYVEVGIEGENVIEITSGLSLTDNVIIE
ncbi:MAG: biotin/lipoyl-binding protein [Lachnospiraceae bacterium]|nr:biotin/lipoyl-binding protein [Lachnospiraceae bacterium]